MYANWEVVDITDVTVQSGDLRLGGTIYVPNDGLDIHSGLLLSTGLGGRRGWWHWMARMLATAGYIVLTFDYRGHGSSEGTAGEGMDDDLRAVVAFLQHYEGVDENELIVGGICLGANFAMYESLKNPAIKAIFGFGVGYEPWLLEPRIWHNMIKLTTTNEDSPLRIDTDSYRRLLEQMDVRKILPDVKVPLLLIHYSEDRFVPLEAGRQLKERAGCPTTLAVIDGGYHIACYRDPQAGVTLLEWLRELQQKGLVAPPWAPPELLLSE